MRRRIPRSSVTKNSAGTKNSKMLSGAKHARRTMSAAATPHMNESAVDVIFIKEEKVEKILDRNKNKKSERLEQKERLIAIPVITSMPDRELSIDTLCSHLDYVIYENKNSLNHKTNSMNLGKIFDRNISSFKNFVDDTDASKIKEKHVNFSSVENSDFNFKDRRDHARRIDAGTGKDNIAGISENIDAYLSSGTFTVHHGKLMHRTVPVPVPCLSFIRGHYKMAWRDSVR